MKRVIIYVMLVFYVAMQLKPLTLIIQDLLAHTFWEVHHLATEHHNHGHNHVHEELADDEIHDHTSPAEKPTSQKLNEETSIHLLEPFNFVFSNRSKDTVHSSNSLHNLAFVYIEISSPPPKV